MLPVFMNFAANGKILFYARCGAREFFDTLNPPIFSDWGIQAVKKQVLTACRSKQSPISIENSGFCARLTGTLEVGLYSP